MALWAFSKRLIAIALQLLIVLTLVFAAVRAVPGDPVDHLLGDHATVAEREALRKRMHLDGPLHVQFLAMLGDFADGTLGSSRLDGAELPVRTLIARRLPSTIALALGALVAAILLSLPLGFGAAVWRDGLFDHGARGAALLAISLPAFVSGPLALYAFAVWLPLLPTPAHDANPFVSLILPALVLGFALSGRLSRLLRASLLEALSADFMTAARARGLSPSRLLLRHALPNAALPVITVLGLQLAALLSGALVTEKVFGRPGLGTLLLDGISARDYAVVQACVVLIGASYAFINLGVDRLIRRLDPRLRLAVAR